MNADRPSASVDDPSKPSHILRNRNFILLWMAYGISALGDHLSELGLLKMQHAMDEGVSNSTRLQAIMGFAFMAPFFLLGPIAGWISDRLPRKWIMFAVDLIRAAIMTEMFWLLMRMQRWMDPNATVDTPLNMWMAIAPLILVGIFAAIFSPARLSLLPTLVRENQIIRANALTAGLGMIATIASAKISGWLVDYVATGRASMALVFRLDALTFVASAICIFLIRPPKRRASTESHDGIAAIRQGFRYVLNHRKVIELILIAAVFWMAASIVKSIIPAVVKDVYHGGYSDIATYLGLIGIGMIVGSLILTAFGDALKSDIAACWCLKLSGLSGLVFTLAVWAGWPEWIVYIALALIGMFGSAIQVSVNALIQKITPNHMRGRAFGVHDLVTMAALLLTTGALGIPNWPNIDRHVPKIMLAVSVVLFATGVITTYIRLRRGPFGVVLSFWKNLNDFVCRLLPRARREGICTIPREGGAIVVANHNSTLDPFVLTSTSPNRIPGFMIAIEFAKIPFFSSLVRAIECIPVTRSGQDTSSVKAALRHLQDGKLLGLFPQGGVRAPDEAIRVRDGVGMLALRSGAPVVPAYIDGITYYDSTVKPFLTRHKAVVRYGEPVDLSEFKGREKDREAYKAASEKIMDAIMALKPIV
ncbi:MAG TPA: MFS transporter [Phycisphaerae bacterium]|nr:MFS transporter [Phycisphaerae bacterium]HRW51717.1 MFS transporter [Phycisphaerae bacterium]